MLWSQYSSQPIVMVRETPELYESIVKPYIQAFPPSRTQWSAFSYVSNPRQLRRSIELVGLRISLQALRRRRRCYIRTTLKKPGSWFSPTWNGILQTSRRSTLSPFHWIEGYDRFETWTNVISLCLRTYDERRLVLSKNGGDSRRAVYVSTFTTSRPTVSGPFRYLILF